MLKLIIGCKGTGKTKQLIASVNETVANDHGSIVFINRNNKYMFDIHSDIRLIGTEDFAISTYDEFYGFFCGVLSQNYDITNVFIDSVTKITGDDFAKAEQALAKLNEAAKKNNVNVIMTASVAVEDAPEFVKLYI